MILKITIKVVLWKILCIITTYIRSFDTKVTQNYLSVVKHSFFVDWQIIWIVILSKYRFHKTANSYNVKRYKVAPVITKAEQFNSRFDMQFVSSEKLFFLVAWSIWSYEIGIWIFPSYIQENCACRQVGLQKQTCIFHYF